MEDDDWRGEVVGVDAGRTTAEKFLAKGQDRQGLIEQAGAFFVWCCAVSTPGIVDSNTSKLGF